MRNLDNINVKIWHDSNFWDDWTNENLEAIGIKFVSKHRNYSLGTEKISGDVVDHIMYESLGLTDLQVKRLDNRFEAGIYSNECLDYLLDRLFKKTVGLRVYIHEHGSVSLSTSEFGCRWDSGMVGYIYVYDTEKFRKGTATGRNYRKKAIEAMENHIEYIDHLANGHHYGFTVEYGEDTDTCGGFAGEPRSEHLIENMVDCVDIDIDRDTLYEKFEEAFGNIEY